MKYQLLIQRLVLFFYPMAAQIPMPVALYDLRSILSERTQILCSLDRPPILVDWICLPRFSEELASRLFDLLLIQLHSSQEHFIDFVIDLRRRQINFTFRVQRIQLDQAAGEDVNENQKAVFVADWFESSMRMA